MPLPMKRKSRKATRAIWLPLKRKRRFRAFAFFTRMPVPAFLRFSISETLITRIMGRDPFRGSQNSAPRSWVFFDLLWTGPDPLLVEPFEKRFFSAATLRQGRGTLATLFPVHHGLLHHSVFKRMIRQNDQPAPCG